MQHHLSNMVGVIIFAFLPSFFVSTCRKHYLMCPLPIMHSIYKAFDHFKSRSGFSSLSLANLLLLPLANIFLSIPDSHWLFRHPRFLACGFIIIIIDDATNRLHLWVRGEYLAKPSLCQRLYKDTLQHRVIRLQPFLWDFILQDVPHTTEDQTTDTLAQQFQHQLLRRQFFSTTFRQLLGLPCSRPRFPIRVSRLKMFWKADMLQQARVVWYRVLYSKLPTMAYLHQINTSLSPLMLTLSSEWRLYCPFSGSLSHQMPNMAIYSVTLLYRYEPTSYTYTHSIIYSKSISSHLLFTNSKYTHYFLNYTMVTMVLSLTISYSEYSFPSSLSIFLNEHSLLE